MPRGGPLRLNWRGLGPGLAEPLCSFGEGIARCLALMMISRDFPRDVACPIATRRLNGYELGQLPAQRPH